MIIGFIGLPGMGKTLGMVNEACRALKSGRKVVSNVYITDTVNKYPKDAHIPQAEYSGDIATSLREGKEALYCIDEASIVLPNYFWNKMPIDYLMKFAQVRKYGLDIYYTSQGYNHTVKRLRDLTNYIVKCTQTRLGFFYDYYDPEYFLMKVPKKYAKEYIVKRKQIFFWKKKKVFQAYNTMQRVETSFIDSPKRANDRYPSF